MSTTATVNTPTDAVPQTPLTPRQIVEHAIAHLDHVLPGQAPILSFVHHNTLHGYQRLPFEQALAEAEQLTGIRAYLPEAAFRKLYRAGRINATDLDTAFAQRATLQVAEALAHVAERTIQRGEILRISLIYGVEALTPSQLIWRMEELDATRRFQDDVPEQARQRLLDATGPDAEAALADLWRASLENFQLPATHLHPEELVDLQRTLAKSLLTRFRAGTTEDAGHPVVHQHMQTESRALIERLFADVGVGVTLRGLLQALTGQDLLDSVRPMLIRCCAAHLDEGLAAWNLPNRSAGLYAAWRYFMQHDFTWTCMGLAEGRETVTRWPDEPVTAIIAELRRLGLPESHWEGYLTRLALELPGWSGMMNWRQQHPGYPANQATPVALADYLA
ncbi:MAG: DUF2309 family protein, partial [Candidatus Competibacteraceae bacterium]|nr:DUF2309 family protein [Candidatus Competibacteraceae bacterium]